MTKTDHPRIIAIDGHEGSGKSTVSARVAARIDGAVARAFPNALGGMIGWLAEKGDFAQANELALLGLQKAMDDNRGAKALVFDRHWVTIYTLLPRAFWPSWSPRPLTVLCWADAATTSARLRMRDGATVGADRCDAAIARFLAIGTEFGLGVIDTTKTDPDTAANQISEIYSKRFG